MANSYGGLILVGVTDGARSDRVVGVTSTAVTQVANGCHEGLEPPREPQIIPVLLPSTADLFVLIIRVDPARAPRPIFHEGRVPIRLSER
jgi:predicted HTH transcriptional regulator